VYARRDAIEAAKAALDQAQRDAVDHLVRVASGTAAVAPTPIRAARSALTDAEDELSAATAARDALAVQLADVERYPDRGGRRVRAAAEAVIQAEGAERANALAGRVQHLQAELIREGAALSWLAKVGVFPVGKVPGHEYGRPTDARTAATLRRVEGLSRTWSNMAADEALGRAPWDAAMEALLQDATARLPEEGAE
jgi:hypothetical protein